MALRLVCRLHFPPNEEIRPALRHDCRSPRDAVGAADAPGSGYWRSALRCWHPEAEGGPLGKVVMYSSVSVDGFIADESDQPGPLFDWLLSGDVPLDESGVLKVSKSPTTTSGRIGTRSGRQSSVATSST